MEDRFILSLRHRMLDAGITPSDMARASGYTKQYISYLLHNRRPAIKESTKKARRVTLEVAFQLAVKEKNNGTNKEVGRGRDEPKT